MTTFPMITISGAILMIKKWGIPWEDHGGIVDTKGINMTYITILHRLEATQSRIVFLLTKNIRNSNQQQLFKMR